MQTDTQPCVQHIAQSAHDEFLANAKSYIDNMPVVDGEFIYLLGTLSAYAVKRMRASQHPLLGMLTDAKCTVYDNICDVVATDDGASTGVAHLEDINKYVVLGEQYNLFEQALLRDDLRGNTLITYYIISCDLVNQPPYVYACYKNWSVDTIANVRDTLREHLGTEPDISFNKLWNGYQITFGICGIGFGDYYENFRETVCGKLYDLEKDYCDDIVQAPTAIDRNTGKRYICSLSDVTKDVAGLLKILRSMQQSGESQPSADAMENIYVIAEEPYQNRVKIGRTVRPVEKRMKQHQTSNADPLKIIYSVSMPRSARFETQLHRIYASRHILGEWFVFSEGELDELFKTMMQPVDNSADIDGAGKSSMDSVDNSVSDIVGTKTVAGNASKQYVDDNPPQHREGTSEYYGRYVAEMKKQRVRPVSIQNISKIVSDKGFSKGKHGSTRCWLKLW